MKRVIYVLALLAGFGILVMLLWPKTDPVTVVEMNQLLQEASHLASELSLPQARPSNRLEWQALMKDLSLRHDLQITLQEASFQQAVIDVAPAPVVNITNLLAELEARGLYTQNIKLLQAEKPRAVQITSLTLNRM